MLVGVCIEVDDFGANTRRLGPVRLQIQKIHRSSRTFFCPRKTTMMEEASRAWSLELSRTASNISLAANEMQKRFEKASIDYSAKG